MDADEIAGNAHERQLLGENPYAYVMAGMKSARGRNLNRYQIERGLLKNMLPLEDLLVGMCK